MQSVAENTNLEDITEAVRSCFDKVTLGHPEKVEAPERAEPLRANHRSLSTDTVIVDEDEQKRMYEEVIAQRRAEKESEELARRMMV